MVERRRYFGLVRWLECDRCGSADCITAVLCANCSATDFALLRDCELFPSWKNSHMRYRVCSVCHSTYERALSYHACVRCVNKHPDCSHSGWWSRTPLEGTTYADCCISCRSVIVTSLAGGAALPCFKYYKVGCPEPSEEPFPCPRTFAESPFQEGIVSCEHRWLEIWTNPGMEGDQHQERRGLENDPLLAHFMDTDAASLDHLAYGETTFWCVDCGFFRRYSPNRRHLLPTYGVKQDTKR